MRERMPITSRLIPKREPSTVTLTGCLLATKML